MTPTMLPPAIFLHFLLAHLPCLTHAIPAPSPILAAASPPATFTANPSIGSGTTNYQDSAHFRTYSISSTTAATTLKIMEAAHACFVETLGWRTPGLSWKDASNAGPWYKTNIYQVSASSMPGAAAQTWNDEQAGLSYLKVVDKYVTEPGVIVHEYGHAMTYSEKNWIDQTRTGAWWETIANFIADTYIATPRCAAAKQNAGVPATTGESLIELPKVIGDSFQVLVDGTSGTGNYYQAWPFLAYLTNNPDAYPGLGNQTIQNMIRKYALNSNETPLHSLARLLSGGTTVQQVVGRYWARMAFVDIGHASARKLFESQWGTLNYANLDRGEGGKYTVKSARAPRYMGANIIPLNAAASTVGVVLSSSRIADLTATLVVKARDGGVRYTGVIGGKGSVSVGSGEEVMLVVANTPALVQYDAFSIPADMNVGLVYSIQVTGATA